MSSKSPISQELSDNYQDCPPKADAMIHSLRAFGYDPRNGRLQISSTTVSLLVLLIFGFSMIGMTVIPG